LIAPQVYEMAVDTILLSFCEDCMSHNETPQYAPKLLMSALGKAGAFRKQQEERAMKKVADGGALTPHK
jgi:solute carrier family 44 (choline transporter-like protein), member 2/4/5